MCLKGRTVIKRSSVKEPAALYGVRIAVGVMESMSPQGAQNTRGERESTWQPLKRDE